MKFLNEIKFVLTHTAKTFLYYYRLKRFDVGDRENRTEW